MGLLFGIDQRTRRSDGPEELAISYIVDQPDDQQVFDKTGGNYSYRLVHEQNSAR